MKHRHIVIIGGGAALAKPLIDHWLEDPAFPQVVTAMCRKTVPTVPKGVAHNLRIVKSLKDIPDDFSIDTLVTLTGTAKDGRIFDLSWDQWFDVTWDCLIAPAMSIGELVPRMSDGGSIVVVGSIVGSTGGYGCANYAASKSGLVGLVRATANEVSKRNIKVNLLELGFMDVGMGARLEPKVRERATASIPLKRFGTERDFVRAVNFLAETDYMTGGVLTLAGGLR